MIHFFIQKSVRKKKRLKSKVNNLSKAKKVDALSRRMEGAVQIDLLSGISTFKKRIPRKALSDAWESGQWDQLDTKIPWDKLNDDLEPYGDALKKAMFAASTIGIESLPPMADKLRWDTSNPRIRHYVDHKAGQFVQGIKDDTRSQIKELVARSFTKPTTPRKIADELVGTIGLNARYKKALSNYKTGLEAQGKSEKVVTDLANKYEAKLLRSRATAIARSETRQATNKGQREVWREAAAQGYVDKNKARRVWVVDGAPCPICEPMDGQETTIDGTYVSDTEGEVEPGEVHTNCECIEILEV